MKLQFPFTIGVFVAGFGALGCGVSNSEIPDKQYWNSDASVSDASVPGSDASSAANGGSGGGSTYMGNDGTTQHHTGGSGGSSGGGAEPVDAGGGGEVPLDAGADAGDSGSPMDAGGGGAGGGEPVAGSSGSGGGGGNGASNGNSCPTEYTMATHVVINVSWDGTIATAKSTGTPQVHIWTKSKFVENGNTATVVSKSCGSVLPTIYASSGAQFITSTDKILPEIPNATWEVSSMPTFTGTATKSGNTVTINPGPALVGLSMTDPTGAWPTTASSVSGVDHDGDMKLGITAIPKTTNGYDTIPVAMASSPRADKLYLAIRNIMTMTATVNGCPDAFNGTANVTKFDNHVIGCHILGGGECTTKQRDFVDENTTVYKLGAATFKSARIDDNATCAQVRAALP